MSLILKRKKKKIYTRFGAVMNSLPNIPQLDEYLCFYIVGRNARRTDLNAAHHTMWLRACAILLDRLSKTWDDSDRKRAILGAFKWLTGCKSYEAVFTDAIETRVLTDEGMKAGEMSLEAASTFTREQHLESMQFVFD